MKRPNKTAETAPDETYVDIVFSEQGSELTFCEVENPAGESVRLGCWVRMPDGFSRLRINLEAIRGEGAKAERLRVIDWLQAR